ncbi:Translin [Viridothelium virens]|uniref:Translin n=1 Tax=Viridothelium virens TaxID=1048519 RepID=A0A6A6GYN1_VIRVR|nr:Translin [Viridothelium virens]
MDKQSDQPSSPFLPMFETFRAELDEHHDRRERIVKASRDITAASKKIIFALQRARQINQPLHQSITKSNELHWENIRTQYSAISPDLQGQNAHRYSRNITGGNQEFMESLSFQHYLETQTLISYQDASARLAELGNPHAPVTLSLEDYVLGIFDMTGELMRFAITAMATSQVLPGSDVPSSSGHAESRPSGIAVGPSAEAMEIDMPATVSESREKGSRVHTRRRDVMQDLRQLRATLEGLDIDRSSPLSWDVQKKMGVMQQSVEKVEKALYGLIVRGRERPKGWMPDLKEEGRRGEVESY